MNSLKNILKIKNYEIRYKEQGAIPLFFPKSVKKNNTINIGSAGGMTRLSTGYTFLNIQDHSRYIVNQIENIKNAKILGIELAKSAAEKGIKDVYLDRGSNLYHGIVRTVTEEVRSGGINL